MKPLLLTIILLSSVNYAQKQKTRKINRQVVVDGLVIDAQEEIVLSEAREYGVIKKESEVNFSIEKFKIGKEVNGSFESFSGEAKLDNATLYYLSGEVLANSINTDNDKRDSHLKSGDFFAVNNYPRIKFKISKVNNFSEGQEFRTKGFLTLKGRKKTIKIKMKVITGENGRYIILGETKIDRYDFGVNWNKRIDKKERSLFETIKDFTQGFGDKYVIDKYVDIKFRLVLLPKA